MSGTAQPPVPDPDSAVSAGAEGHQIMTSVGEAVRLVAGSRTAIVGADGAELLEQLIGWPGAALLLPDAAAPLHSGYSLGDQIAAVLAGTRRAALDRATDLLEVAGMPEPHHRVTARPHQLTALDRQRAQLALALANEPRLVLAEDPTAGLSPADANAFSASVFRLHAKLHFTLVVVAREKASVQRLVSTILRIEDGQIVERLRAQPQSSSPSST